MVTMDFRKRKSVLEDINRKVEQALSASPDRAVLEALARETADAVEAISAGIERHTSVVCPECRDVCCVNRHCYHEYADIVYLCSLGERPASYREGAGDGEPCQFLGAKGCRLRRSLRPHRCTWFFCTPLLDHVRESSSRDYRALIAALGEINRNRCALLHAFGAVMSAQGNDAEALKRLSDEIFFRYE